MTLTIPWPRYPVETPGGKVSRSKTAGKMRPWLSANNVAVLHPRVYREHRAAWREATHRALLSLAPPVRIVEGDCVVSVRLYKAGGHLMDSLAVLEGIKPCLDAAECVLYGNDRQVVGGRAAAFKAASRDQCRVEITLIPVVG